VLLALWVRPPPISVAELLERHEASLGRLYSFHAVIASRGRFAGQEWQPMETIRFYRTGSREKVTVSRQAIPIHGVLQSAENDVASWLATLEGVWSLEGYDPEQARSLPPPFVEQEASGVGPRVSRRISAPFIRGPHG
jgi:hypothetical protein